MGHLNTSPLLYFIQDHAEQNDALVKELTAHYPARVEIYERAEETPPEGTPTVIITDFSVLDDSEQIDQLRFTFAVPIITLSDRPSMSQAVRAMRAGASDFFPKPVSIKALSDRITALTHGAFSMNQNEIRLPKAITPFWLQERAIIENALSLCDGNISRAAAALEISPSTIYRKKQAWLDNHA